MQLIRRKFILYWVKTSNPTKLQRISGHKVPAASEYHALQISGWHVAGWASALKRGHGLRLTFWILCKLFDLPRFPVSGYKSESRSPLEFVNRIRELINVQTTVFWNPRVFLHLDLKLSPMHCHPWSPSFRNELENKYVLIFNVYIKMFLGAPN